CQASRGRGWELASSWWGLLADRRGRRLSLRSTSAGRDGATSGEPRLIRRSPLENPLFGRLAGSQIAEVAGEQRRPEPREALVEVVLRGRAPVAFLERAAGVVVQHCTQAHLQ